MAEHPSIKEFGTPRKLSVRIMHPLSSGASMLTPLMAAGAPQQESIDLN